MNWLTFFVPTILLMHNTVDFSRSGGCQSYVNCLNYVVTNYTGMLEDNNPTLHLVNYSGHFDETIHSLELQFESTRQLPLEEARLMILQLIDSFAAAINNFPRLHAHLADCPFSAANITIRVNFLSTCFYPYSETKYIRYMSFVDGVITYEIENPYNPGQLVKIRDEPLRAARALSEMPQ